MNTTKIAIIDFEATCDNSEKVIPRGEMEIIEIGCVIADLKGNTYNHFSTFVKPILHPNLTPFCKELTHISQEDVDSGLHLLEAFKNMNLFLRDEKIKTWTSWGDWDKTQVHRNIKHYKKMKRPFEFMKFHYFDLSEKYYKHQGLPQTCGLIKALARHKIEFTGTPHRGLDDVINTAKLLPFSGL